MEVSVFKRLILKDVYSQSIKEDGFLNLAR